MPYIHVFLNKQYSSQKKEKLMHSLSHATAQSLGASPASVRVKLIPLDSLDTMVAGVVGVEIAEVYVYLMAGRSTEQKEALFRAINIAVQDSLEVAPDLSRTVIQDVATIDLGLAGGLSAKQSGY